MKMSDGDVEKKKGIQVNGGREGLFIEKPDIVDKFSRRKITVKNPELRAMGSLQFAKMYEPIRGKTKAHKYEMGMAEDGESSDQQESSDQSEGDDLWKDDEDRVANFYITTDEKYNRVRLPEFIIIENCQSGEVPIWRKRSFPKAARIHKKNEESEPHRFFLSELMLYHGFIKEEELGCDDETKCRNLYLEKKDAIQYVKRYLLPFAQGVEEARHYVEQALQNEPEKNNFGEVLDPELEKENEECRNSEEQIHPDYVLNPNDFEFDNSLAQVRKSIRNIRVTTANERLENARRLDEFQKKALNMTIDFAMNVIMSRKGKQPHPRAPFLMIHGGAGSGKSTLIHVISQYMHHLLRREGDDPDCPVVLLSAFTGTAAANINGQTLHTLFSFNFGAGYMSLSDKKRDEKRNLYRNLKMLIIDEISLVDSDMFYKIDLRLREITQIGMPMGNVAILVLGDLMQMKPITGRYIFCEPRNSQFQLTHEIDPLWRKFECINLEINHRQGEDKDYADTLNRIRVGEETSKDIEILKERVREVKHRDLIKTKDALHIFGTNKNVNAIHNKRLNSQSGEEHKVEAIVLHKTMKNFNPPVDKRGEVGKTGFQKVLKVKIGAKVMLIYNVDTADGLTNGARGELMGLLFDSQQRISKLVIKFDKESVGEEKRRNFQEMQKKYPGGTPIEKVNFSFSISKSKTSVINTANII